MTELIRDFLDPAEFFKAVQRIGGIEHFCGVPDSLLKGIFHMFFFLYLFFDFLIKFFVVAYFYIDFCSYVSTNVSKENHVITANEGSAVAVAAG